MLGIYFHIPFCKSKCVYCDFYSITNHTLLPATLSAMMQEISLRRAEYAGIGASEATIYFGGGTPSLLIAADIKSLAQKAVEHFGIQHITEFTVELNPDDITADYLRGLKDIGVTRLSIGVQSFFDTHLQFMRRRHSAQQAIDSIAAAQEAGFDNISIDLIYGLPNLLHEEWQQTLDTAFSLGIQHISAYCLTAEPHTPLSDLLQKKLATIPLDDDTAQQYDALCGTARQYGYEHYEISNFALPHRYALHNTNYWRNIPYIGIGAAAHSYVGNVRQANTADVQQYIRNVENRDISGEQETLTPSQLYNELILKGLRTQWGVDIDAIRETAGIAFASFFEKNVAPLLNIGRLAQCGTRFTIPQRLWFVSDGIIEELIFG